MKMMYKMYVMPCVYLFSFLFAFTASAKQKAVKTQLDDSVTIEGKILDTTINKMPNRETEIFLLISTYPYNNVRMNYAEHISYKIKVRHNERFKFIVPALAKRFYMSIYYIPFGNNSFSSQTNVYMLEKGDHINCILTENMYKFAGKGSEKLNCQSELSRALVNLKNWGKLYSAKQFDQLAMEENKLGDSCLELQKGIIKKYLPLIGKETNDILLANIYGMRYFPMLVNYRSQASNRDFYNGFINSKGYANIDKNVLVNVDPKILVQAPIYTDFLFEKVMMQTRMFENGVLESNISQAHIMRVFKVITEKYNGILRDKLIATFFLQWQAVAGSLDYLEPGLQLVNDVKYKQILKTIQKKNLKGQPFYPFELEDSGGKIVKLQDLNNKVVIIDFWYTGCGGCINLKRAMEGVWETYKNNTNVAFVSISIDKDKDEWKKSILTKIYTEPTSINLYTGGEGKEHQIIKNLEIVAYPRMYLLKNGKLYSANTPWPSGPDTTKGTTKEYIDLIAKAINEK